MTINHEPEHRIAIEDVLSVTLIVGVMVSILIIVTGLAISLVNHQIPVTAHIFTQAPKTLSIPHTFSTILLSVKKGNGAGVIMVGLFALILTPILRVGMSCVIFIRDKDLRYSLITFWVFLVLIASFFIGHITAS